MTNDTYFINQIKQALQNFHNPICLAQNSPLATPYFLGEHLLNQTNINPTNPKARGQTLQNLLKKAVEALKQHLPHGPDYYLCINLKYFNNQSISLNQRLKTAPISPATFYRKIEPATQQVAQQFIQLLNPALHLERPQAPQLFDRDSVLKAANKALTAQKTIALIGPGGIGKSALGANLANRFKNKFFWFTLIPTLNDNLHSLLFALAYFLHHHLTTLKQPSALFAELTVNQDNFKLDAVIGLLQRDLAKLSKLHFIFCFDELDLLRPLHMQPHAQIVNFLNALIHLPHPILLIGQTNNLQADIVLELQGLSKTAIHTLLNHNQPHNINLTNTTIAALQKHTQGNPRLLQLFIILHQQGDNLDKLLFSLKATPSLEFLLNRIWQRLHPEEIELLAALSVFRQIAPADAWSNQTIIKQLQQRHLIEIDQKGGLRLLPIYREIIYAMLTNLSEIEDTTIQTMDNINIQKTLHLKAADIRAKRGEFTAAAYHFIKGGKPSFAVWLWHQYQTQEINQGQGQAALTIFQAIPLKQLQQEDREALLLLQAELKKLTGNFASVSQTLQTSIRHNSILRAMAKRLKGDIAELKSNYTEAIKHYQAGLQSIEHLLSQKAIFHKNLSWVYSRNRDLNHALYHAQLALYEGQNNIGLLHMELGDYQLAKSHLQAALAIAEAISHLEGQAKSHDNLASVYTYLKHFDKAEAHQKKALEIYQRIGRINRQAGVLNNQAFTYNAAAQPQKAIEVLHKALNILKQVGEERGAAIATQNLAEAYFELGQLNEAEKYARQVHNTEETITLPHCLWLLGKIKLKQKEFVAAERFLQYAIDIGQKNQDKYIEALAWQALMQVFLKQTKQAEAENARTKALALFEALGMGDEMERDGKDVGFVEQVG